MDWPGPSRVCRVGSPFGTGGGEGWAHSQDSGARGDEGRPWPEPALLGRGHVYFLRRI